MKAVMKLAAVLLVLAATAAVVAVATLWVLGKPRRRVISIEQRQAAEGVPVSVVRPTPMEFTDYLDCDGSVVADVRAMLRSKIEEVVEAVHADVGDPVQKGQVLVAFRKADLEADVKAAETAFEEARNSCERYSMLAEQQVVSQDRLEQVRTRRDAAGAALEAAASRLKFAELASPIDGYVDARWVEPGEFKGIGKELLSIVNLSTVQVRALVSEGDVARIAIGEDAEFQLESSQTWVPGRVERISPVTNDPNRFFEVFLKVQNPRVGENWLMRPGMYAAVRFVRGVVTGALGVPVAALVHEGSDQVVYLARPGKVRRPVLARGEAPKKGFLPRMRRGLARARTMLSRAPANPGEGGGAQQWEEVDGARARRIVLKPGLSAGDYVQVSDGEITEEVMVIVNPSENVREGAFVRVVEGGD